jgi:hypothetical protein
MRSMIQLAYLSSSPAMLASTDVKQILAVSRINNERRDVTGMLLYRQGNFLQIIEGERDTVEALFKIIARDPRHRQITRMFAQQIEKRDFPNWTMGFREFTAKDAGALDGFIDIFDPSFDMSTFAASRAATLVEIFKAANR